MWAGVQNLFSHIAVQIRSITSNMSEKNSHRDFLCYAADILTIP